MKELLKSKLPIFMDETTYDLTFKENLTCEGSGSRSAKEVTALLKNPKISDPEEKCYSFYRNIVFDEHRALYEKNDFRYDITVICPGTINGECKKTSGHYHGYIEGQPQTYPEIYEVLEGRALYVLQKAMNFDQEEEPVFEDRMAVIVEAGQAIVIPPFYGHCSVNIGDGPLVFSNIAVVACPLFYDAMKEKRGLSIYAMKDENGKVTFENNPNYLNVGEIKIYRPVENEDMGIVFDGSVYWQYVNHPEKFDYLLNPEKYIDTMLKMYFPTEE